jgi:hypothetical protein
MNGTGRASTAKPVGGGQDALSSHKGRSMTEYPADNMEQANAAHTVIGGHVLWNDTSRILFVKSALTRRVKPHSP